MGRPPALLICTFSESDLLESNETAAWLSDAGFPTTTVSGATETITSIVALPPDAIIVYTSEIEHQELFRLLAVVKSERDFARIPVILTTSNFDGDGIHFHLGDSGEDVRTAVDYIGEQVASVLRANSYRMDAGHSDDVGQESGILRDSQRELR